MKTTKQPMALTVAKAPKPISNNESTNLNLAVNDERWSPKYNKGDILYIQEINIDKRTNPDSEYLVIMDNRTEIGIIHPKCIPGLCIEYIPNVLHLNCIRSISKISPDKDKYERCEIPMHEIMAIYKILGIIRVEPRFNNHSN